MNTSIKVVALITTLTLLSGCKIITGFGAKLSTIETEKPKKFETHIMIEVSACNDYEDSRKESDDLKKLKNTIKKQLTAFKFKGCHSQQMDSYADYDMPIYIGGVKPNKEWLSIDNQYRLTFPPALKTKFDNIADDITSFNFSFFFKFKNTGDKPRDFIVIGFDIDDAKRVYNKVTIKQGETIDMLSGSLIADELMKYGSITIMTKK